MNEREKLEALNKSLRDSLTHQLNDGKESTKAWLKKALVVGGSAALVYGIAKALTSDGNAKPPKKKVKARHKKYNDEPLYLVETTKNEVIAWALTIAAEKLRVFLNKLEEDEEGSLP